MTEPRAITVGETTEREVLARVFAELEGSSVALVGPGDDAAVLAVPGERMVVSTDTLVHGPDFRLAWSSGYDLGFKAAAVNLSDIAAMGARPTALFVALAMPDSTTLEFVGDVARGLRGACDVLAAGCAVEGGDLTVSDTLTIAVTAVGVTDGRAPVLRSGAGVGDVVAVAGELGRAAQGLDILFTRFRDAAGEPVPVVDAELSDLDRVLLSAQLRPEPPVAAGIAASHAGATAMMDVSDGLLLDATRLADASNVTIALAAIDDPYTLSGGEDHALLATFPADAALPSGFTPIGEVVRRGDCSVLIGGEAPSGRGGWDPYQDWDSRRG